MGFLWSQRLHQPDRRQYQNPARQDLGPFSEKSVLEDAQIPNMKINDNKPPLKYKELHTFYFTSNI